MDAGMIQDRIDGGFRRLIPEASLVQLFPVDDAFAAYAGEALKLGLAERRTPTTRSQKAAPDPTSQPLAHLLERDPDFDFLCSMGGHTHAT